MKAVSLSINCEVSVKTFDPESCPHHNFGPDSPIEKPLEYIDALTGQHTTFDYDAQTDSFIRKRHNQEPVNFVFRQPSPFQIQFYLGLVPRSKTQHIFVINAVLTDEEEDAITHETTGPRFLTLTEAPTPHSPDSFSIAINDGRLVHTSFSINRQGYIAAYFYDHVNDYDLTGTPFIDFIDPKSFSIAKTYTLPKHYKGENMYLDDVFLAGDYVYFHLDCLIAVYDPINEIFVATINHTSGLSSNTVHTKDAHFTYFSPKGATAAAHIPRAYYFNHIPNEVFLYTALVFFTDGYIKTKFKKTDTARFFDIASKLPLELKAKLAHLTNNKNKDFVTAQQAEPAFRAWAKSLAPTGA